MNTPSEGDVDIANWGACIVRNDCVDKQTSNGIIVTRTGCTIERDLVVSCFIIGKIIPR